MNINQKLLKLAKMIMKFATVETDKGVLYIDGELLTGALVYIEDENGEFVAPEDGAYETEDLIVTVKDGAVEKIEQKEAPVEDPEKVEVEVDKEMEEQAPADEEAPAEDPKDAQIKELETKITELEGLLQDRDAIISELTAKIKELEDKAKAPVEEPVKMSATVRNAASKENSALKYFN